MSVSSVNEIHNGRGIAVDDKGVRTLTRAFHVETTNAYDEQLTVCAASGVPRRGDFYSTTGGVVDLTLTCRSVRAQQDEDRLHWTVTAEYSDKRTSEKDKEPNPLLRNAEISRGFAIFQKIAEKAVNDNSGDTDYGNEAPIVNSAMQPFVPAVQVDDARYVLTITKNFVSYNDNTGFQYRNAVNSDSFFGAAERTWKIFSITVPPQITERVNDTDVEYYAVTVEMQYRPETWDLDILDAGFKEFKTANTSTDGLKDILDEDGQPHAEPQLLNGSGTALAPNGTPAYRKYRYYPEKSFGALNLI